MIKSLGKITLVTVLAVAAMGMPLQAGPPATPAAPDAKATTPAAPETKPKPLPFRGKIGALDKTAKTITLDETTKRVFQITSETKLMRDGKPATFDTYAIGEAITGQYTKGDDGKLTAKSILFGAKMPPKGQNAGGPSAPATKSE